MIRVKDLAAILAGLQDQDAFVLIANYNPTSPFSVVCSESYRGYAKTVGDGLSVAFNWEHLPYEDLADKVEDDSEKPADNCVVFWTSNWDEEEVS